MDELIQSKHFSFVIMHLFAMTSGASSEPFPIRVGGRESAGWSKSVNFVISEISSKGIDLSGV